MGDHCFVGINQPKNLDGSYPDFSSWAPTSYVIDSWAEIVCAGPKYPEKWSKRMTDWARSGLLIDDQLPYEWIDLVDQEKTSYLPMLGLSK